MTKSRSLLLALAACGTSSSAPPDATGDVFLAFTQTFAPFRTWTSFHSDGPADDGTFTPDVLGPREQYINHVPPPGSKTFPIGTVIVEARASGILFAAVKRGGGFNATGAIDWEWFEITENPVTVVWRGFGPPSGEMYGGDPHGSCNACHAACGGGNDFICSPKLQLSAF